MSVRLRLLLSAILFLFGGSSYLAAQDHVVKLTDLHRDFLAATEKRKESVARVQQLFENQPAIQALSQVGISPDVVKDSVASLSSSDLAQLEERMTAAESATAASGMSTTRVTLIIVAAAILAIVATLAA